MACEYPVFPIAMFPVTVPFKVREALIGAILESASPGTTYPPVILESTFPTADILSPASLQQRGVTLPVAVPLTVRPEVVAG